MAFNFTTRYAASIGEVFLASSIATSGSYTQSVSEWEPIQYSSMVGWFFLNYAALLLMIAIPLVIAWGLLR